MMIGSTTKSLQIGFLSVLLLLISVSLVWAENVWEKKDLLKWLDKETTPTQYKDFESDFFDLFTRNVTSPVVPDLLMERLYEGGAKRVPAERLLDGLSKEKERLQRVVRIVAGIGYTELSIDNLKPHVKALSIALRGDLTFSLVEEILEESFKNEYSLTVGVSACTTLFQISRITFLTEKDFLKLGNALLNSSLPASGYSSLTSVFIKGRGSRLKDSDIMDIIVRILERGGGLVQIEREISRRTRRR